MKTLLIALAALFSIPIASAESGATGISIILDENRKPKVSIVSTWKGANVQNATVAVAAKLIAGIRGADRKQAVLRGSIDFVGVVAHDVPLRHYMPILDAIAGNSMLRLYFVDGTQGDGISNNIRKMIEQDVGLDAE